MKNILSILLLAVSFNLVAQFPSPGKKQEKSIIITNVVIHIGNGEMIKNGAVAFENGKIKAVLDASKTKITLNGYDQSIDGKGQHLYPGFILPNTTLGITEIDAVRATNDFSEVGQYKPNVRSLIAYNTESEVIATVRTNGVMIGQPAPKGGVVTGTSSVVHFDAWNWEDAVIREDDGIHLNWPRQYQTSGWWAEPGPTSKSKKYDERVLEIQAFFKKARAYQHVETKEVNLVLRATKGLFDGTQNLYVHCNTAKEITEVVHFAKSLDLKKVVIVGGKQAHLVASILKENNISVILSRAHTIPSTQDSNVDEMYAMASKLDKANVLYCLDYSGDMDAMGARNLPFTAGTTVAYGMDYEKAVQSITLNSAKILGIDANYGSIEVGKSATLFLSEGDALDMRTNQLTKAYTDGRLMDLNNHQKDLNKKYTEKYGIE